jgi:hypothetical protein
VGARNAAPLQKDRWLHVIAVVILVAAAIATATYVIDNVPTPAVGHVIDQDTGEAIPGAVVVGRYEGLINGAQGCTRIESAVTDQQGRFEFSLDHRSGSLITAAYAKGYTRGKPLRYAVQPEASNPQKWQVAVLRWNAQNTSSEIARLEPEVFWSERAARERAREFIDVYLRRSAADRESRLRDLQAWLIEGSCAGGARSSEGAVPFFTGVLQELEELGATDERLTDARGYLESSRQRVSRAR